MDWYSRYVLAWRLSNTLDLGFCVEAYEESLRYGAPDIHNTDQGASSPRGNSSRAWRPRVRRVSWDGCGRALDNVFIERLWWSVKHENVHLWSYGDGHELHEGLGSYFEFYNHSRPSDGVLGFRQELEAKTAGGHSFARGGHFAFSSKQAPASHFKRSMGWLCFTLTRRSRRRCEASGAPSVRLVASDGDRGGRRRRKVFCRGGFATFASGGQASAPGGGQVSDLDHWMLRIPFWLFVKVVWKISAMAKYAWGRGGQKKTAGAGRAGSAVFEANNGGGGGRDRRG